MGTRRSRHNKGRKPIYKEHRMTASELISRPIYANGGFFDTFTHWNEEGDTRLVTLCLAGADIDQAAASIGRPPNSLLNRVREKRLPMPTGWAKLIERRKKPRLPAAPSIALAYPYIRKERDDNRLVLDINNLVPKTLPASMRADVCQEILLAILEGEILFDDLKREPKPARWFISNFYKLNHEDSGHATSLDTSLGDSPMYEVISNIAAADWIRNEHFQLHRQGVQRKFYEAPTQINDLFKRQIEEEHKRRHERGDYSSFEDVCADFEAGGNMT